MSTTPMLLRAELTTPEFRWVMNDFCQTFSFSAKYAHMCMHMYMCICMCCLRLYGDHLIKLEYFTL